MSALNVIVTAAVITTGLTVLARAELASPRVRSPYVSNPAVRLLMDVTAFACVPLAAALWRDMSVNIELAFFLITTGLCSLSMLVSMLVHGGRITVVERATEVRVDDVSEVRAAVEETVPRAIDQALPDVLKDLAARPDPYEPH